MFEMGKKYMYLFLVIGFAVLGVVPSKVQAVCDIEDVCELVAKEKQNTEPTSDDNKPTLEKKTIAKIKKKCDLQPPESSVCPMSRAVKLCWEKESTAIVIELCGEDDS